jgi:hypothetical protein
LRDVTQDNTMPAKLNRLSLPHLTVVDAIADVWPKAESTRWRILGKYQQPLSLTGSSNTRRVLPKPGALILKPPPQVSLACSLLYGCHAVSRTGLYSQRERLEWTMPVALSSPAPSDS